MRFLKRFAKWSLVAFASVVLIISALWLTARVIYPTDAQRQAAAEMARWPAYEGENAYALLWTLEHAVPEDAIDVVMAEDVRQFSPGLTRPAEMTGGSVVSPSTALPSAANVYPDLAPGQEDTGLFCGLRQADCLARVKEDLASYQALIERNDELLDRVDQLQGYGFIRSEFPYSPWSPWPGQHAAKYTKTRNAVLFVEGRHDEAIASTCRDILTWRRLGSRSDSLIWRMSGDALSTESSGPLLAEMLAQYPVDAPLPEPCTEALAPPATEELTLCNALRGEYGANANVVDLPLVNPQTSRFDRFAAQAFVDPEAARGMMAEGYLAYCGDPGDTATQEELEEILRDRSELRRLECASNLHQCVLQALVFPALDEYQDRVTDHAARLRALGTLAWMRSQVASGRSPAELLANRPGALNDEGDQMTYGPEGQTLEIVLRWTRRGEAWSIPLPPALQPQAAPGVQLVDHN
mgnify:CR=1 FL=1